VSRRTRGAAALLAASAAVLCAAPAAEAHGLAGRADLPIPIEFFGVGAAIVLVLSFAALGALWSQPRLQRIPERRLFRAPLILDVVLGTLGVVVFGLAVWAGLAGTDVERDNLGPALVYVVFWVGVPFASLLFGDVWRLLSPWRAIGRATGAIAKRFAGDDMPEPLAYPARVGQWPAAAVIFGFAVCELCWATGREPGPLAIIMVLYLVYSLVGMSIYGVEAWTRNADGFGVLFSLFASLAPFFRRDGVLYARPPVIGATALQPDSGTIAVLLTSIGSTAFDGAKEGPLFNDAIPHVQTFFEGLGLSKGAALEWGFVLGLVIAIAFVSMIWWLGIEGMPRVRGLTRGQLSDRLAHSLIPIVAAYLVAHYFSLLAYNGQDLWRLASDPLGNGSDLFGGANFTIDYSVVTTNQIWYVQVGSLVLGHVSALVLAHDRALILYGGAKEASRSQIVMLIVMVAFTLLGLWLLSSAL
jgi:hypothetical protein